MTATLNQTSNSHFIHSETGRHQAKVYLSENCKVVKVVKWWGTEGWDHSTTRNGEEAEGHSPKIYELKGGADSKEMTLQPDNVGSIIEGIWLL